MSSDDRFDVQRLADAALAGDELDLTDAQDRTLPAEALQTVLLDRSASISVLRIRGARISGPLHLAYTKLPVVSFSDCTFSDWIELADAATRALAFTRCRLVGVDARNAAIAGTVALTACHVSERIDLGGAHVSGRLDLTASVIQATSEGPGLDADDLLVTGTLEAAEAEIAGMVLSSASIGGHLRLQGATLTANDAVALQAPGVRVGGAVDLRPRTGRRFTAAGQVTLSGASIGASLELGGARMENGAGAAFVGDSLTVVGAIHGQPVDGHRLEVRGEFRLADARAAKIDLSGSRFTVSKGVAVYLAGVELSTDLQCTLAADLPFEVHGGRLVLTQAEIGDELNFRGAQLHNAGDVALAGDAITVHGPAFFSTRDGHRFVSEGQVRLVDGDFGSSLLLGGAAIRHPKATALMCDRITVAANAFLSRLDDATTFEADGSVSLVGARITSQLRLDGARIAGTLTLSECSVSSLMLNCGRPPEETILRNSDVGTLYVLDAAKGVIAPRHVVLDGLTYRTLDSIARCSVSDHLTWLKESDKGYRPQPYEQLAQVYAAHGREEEARTVLIAKQRRRRATLPRRSRLGSLVLGATVAHGYRSWQAGLWLLALLAAGTLLFTLAFDASLTDANADFTPTRDAAYVPVFEPRIYTLDVLLPVIDLGQATAWNAHDAAQWVAVGLALSGWLLTAALVAGIAAKRR